MDIFKYINPNDPSKMEAGAVVNGLTSKMWVERYVEPGEFTFTADSESGLKEFLPEGTFVSHVGTGEIMVVENHEITEERGRPSELVITGRGLETFFEQRVARSEFSGDGTKSQFILAADYLVNQIVTLIRKCIVPSEMPSDLPAGIPYVDVVTTVVPAGDSVEQNLKRAYLYDQVIEFLNFGGLGIKVVRPGFAVISGVSAGNTAFVIHEGVNRSDKVMFSSDTGEIERAEYLWSNKNLKNAAVVSGRWLEVEVPSPLLDVPPAYKFREMLLDASDLDGQYPDIPGEPDASNIMTAMRQRGYLALLMQKRVALTRTEISGTATKAVYRRDFDVGDIITVRGNYNETKAMRVTEFVEIEDKEGSKGTPTLSDI